MTHCEAGERGGGVCRAGCRRRRGTPRGACSPEGSNGQCCLQSPAKPKCRSSLLPVLGGCSATAAQGSVAGVEPEPWAGGDAVAQGSAGGKPEDNGTFTQGSEAAAVAVPGGKSQGPAEVCWDEALAWETGSPPVAGTGTQGSAAPAQAEAADSTLGFVSERRREVGEGNTVGHRGMLNSRDVPGGSWLPAAPPRRAMDQAAEREEARGP